jgi:two-component system, chemotaxis family, CheB/CheR fusion protein
VKSEVDQSFEELLEFVRDTRGFDYTSYKRPSLMRRVEKQMQMVGVESYEDYRHYLEAEPREFDQLFNTILINVTGFFRDPQAWDYVASETVPRLLASRSNGEAIRIWSAGCASGEEAYTAGMILAEALGELDFRERVKIYATDIDEEALTEARHAVFGAKRVAAVPDELRDKYFQRVDGEFVVRGDLRRAVVFGRNDLISDPPISRVDLIISRNTLMYFGSPAQQRILSNFYFALNPDGFLFLGKAEALMSRTNFFVPVDLQHRVFQPHGGMGLEPYLPPAAAPAVVPPPKREERRLQEATFEGAPQAQLVVDLGGNLSLLNHHARILFGLSPDDVGRPLRDLEVSYRPVELRSKIEQALDQRKEVVLRDVVWPLAGEEDRHFDVTIAPILARGGETVGVGVAFADVSRSEVMRSELEQARQELEQAYEELQSTVEELETTNEELQSTNEELETTNEELQSTNEELETMNEELQSTNEELETMNDEMGDRTDEALRANSFLGSVLSSITQSVVVLDAEFRVTAWSEAASALWGLRADEVVGQFFLNLDIGLPVTELKAPIRHALARAALDDVELDARDRRGKAITTRVALSPLLSHQGEIEGVILVMTSSLREELAAE